MSDWNLKEIFRFHLDYLRQNPSGLMMPRPVLRNMGIHCILTLFGERQPLWAQSDLDQDNAQIQEQIQATQHPMLEDMPDRWEASALDLPWIIKNRLPWNESLRSLCKDTLNLTVEQCKAMDSLVKAHGRPEHATFWMMLPWMESMAALVFQQALDREFPNQNLEIRTLKSGMEVLYRTCYQRSHSVNQQPTFDEEWQYRIRQQIRNIGYSITLEKPSERRFVGIPGFFIQGIGGKILWLLGDFHPQSGNRLFCNTRRIPAFANPWAHIPGSEIPFASSRMSGGNQTRGFSLQSTWGTHLIVMNSYALGILSSSLHESIADSSTLLLTNQPKTALWMHSFAWEKERTWGILGVQLALPSSIRVPATVNSSILSAQIIQTKNTLASVDQIINNLKALGINYKIQRKNYFFQSNFTIRPSNPLLSLNKAQKPKQSFIDFLLSWNFSHLHTLVMTPHPHWTLGLRWSKLSHGSEALRSFSIALPIEGTRQSLDINTLWSPVHNWSITFRSHWLEEGPIQGYGNHFTAWNRGLEGRMLKGPFKDSRYTMIYKQAGRGRQGNYLFQYLRMPWPLSQRKGLEQGMSGFVQVAHGYSNPNQQTWVIAYNLLWKRIFRTQSDLKIGQTWVIAGPEGEHVTVREDQSFGTGWWTGSSGQYRFTASLQGRSGGNGWRLWVRRTKDDGHIRWECGLTFSQRWNEN